MTRKSAFVTSPYQQSFEQLQMIEEMRARPSLSNRDALFVATQTVVHGQPMSDDDFCRLAERSEHPGFQAYVQKLRDARAVIARARRLPWIRDRKELWEKLYSLDAPVMSRGKAGSDKLLVIFGTMYNNFNISYAVLMAMLMDLGVSILLLKDCTSFNYLRGAAGMSHNLPGIADRIRAMAKESGAKRLYFAGFSSGSYAALHTALQTRAAGYLGFSAITDLSAHSPCPPPKFFIEDIRRRVDDAHLRNLREMAAETAPDFSGTIYYGDRSEIDTAHALNMQDLPNFGVVRIADGGHDVPLQLISQDRFYEKFADLVAR